MSASPSAVSEDRDFPAIHNGLLHSFFFRAVRRWPDRIAVDVPPGGGRPGRTCVTYAELARQSRSLALALRPMVTGECVVAILLNRNSPGLYAAQLAVLQSGAAYTCIDPSFPEERMRLILEDARPVAVLTDAAGRERMARAGLEIPSILAGEAPALGTEPKVPFEPEPVPWLTPGHLAYIIYTSGTTGRPKGVMIEHRGIANLVASDLDTFGLGPEDRVAQGSSPAYDSSVEETWLALSCGAAVVVMDDETSRLGPDLVPWLRDERITVFCPPPTQLRAAGCVDPASVLPDLRLLYVGGEPLPRDVADRWARGRSLVNGYGPTECTVTCLRGPVQEGAAIGIGQPVRGVSAWILDENLREVAAGTPGELCIGGVGLARGYLRQPGLTAEKFVVHPRFGRIYRTGDLARVDEPGGQFFHLGRIDSQVKLRGFRIELEEIESRLAGCPGVRSAACRIQQEESGPATLVAFVVPEDPASPPLDETLRASLKTVLPSYMVPSRVGILEDLPRTVGGKLNRSALPRLEVAVPAAKTDGAAPGSELESIIAQGVAAVLRLSGGVSIHADFFTDLGGDSLSAAELVTRLRNEPATSWIAARDIYEARTVAGLAARAPAGQSFAEGDTVRLAPVSGIPVWLVVFQGLWLLKELVIGSAAAYLAALHVLPAMAGRVGWLGLALLAPVAGLVAMVVYSIASVWWAVGLKRLLIGAYTPMRAPVWGSFYLRNWMVQRAVRQIPWSFLDGTEFKNMALRALGARIGRRVHIHRGVDLLRGGWDLLEIGDDVTLGQEVALGLVEFENHDVVVSPVTLHSGCTLGTHAFVSGGASVGESAWVATRALVAPGTAIPAGERWDGIPARRSGLAPPVPPLPEVAHAWSPGVAGVWLILSQWVLFVVLALPVEVFAFVMASLTGTSAEGVSAWLLSPSIDLRLMLASAAVAALPVPVVLLLEALTCRVLGGIPPGVISRWSPGFIRIWLKTGLLESGSQWLYGTLFWPIWLRWAGMKLGKGCEISSLYDSIPENVEIGEKTFCADGIYLASPRIQHGTVTVAGLKVGRNSFFGNGAVLAGGLSLPDDVLLGVCTVAEGTDIRAGTSWFGHPPMQLPRRQVVRMDPRLTHNPSPVRYLVRLFWECLRFILPVLLAAILPAWYTLLAQAETALPRGFFLLVVVPIMGLGATLLTALLIVAIKWILLGRVRPGVHPLWSSWASRWDFVCLAWNLYMKPVVGALDGTPGLAVLLRAMGVRIGRGVVLGTGFAEDIPDPDMLTFEDGATVDCLFQAHTFEDHVLKMDYITVRSGATLGRNAVLLYGSEVGAGTRVMPNSVVMKQERLLPGLVYEGFPTRARQPFLDLAGSVEGTPGLSRKRGFTP